MCSTSSGSAACSCYSGWAGQYCDIQCDLQGDRVDISFVVDVSGYGGYKNEIYDFITSLVDMFDTQTEVMVSLTSFSDQAYTHIDPVTFITNDNFDSVVNNMGKV